MCAPISLLIYTLICMSMMFDTRMVTEGLPLMRQERGADRGLLAGADFLSVFMSSSLRQAYRETTTPEPTETTPEDYTRATRSTSSFTTSPIAQSSTEDQYETTISAQFQSLEQSSDSSLNDGDVVVAVHVSSSVGRTITNKDDSEYTTTEIPTTLSDQEFVASEEHPSIIAEANKSEFSVEEREPITSRDLEGDFVRGYPASVQPLPRNNPSQNFGSEFITRLTEQNKDKFQPIQETVVYHNNPREPGRARSVSYSTVIQTVPQPQKDWVEGKHDRHERHYNLPATYANNYQHLEKTNQSAGLKDWETSTSRNSLSTAPSWNVREKSYRRPGLPAVYGQPEQNYEVDESVSVMSNGRVHGVQAGPTLPTKVDAKKADDSQKVGYVVEGRNYRQYRVEERTADGFIVGEYGVLSHDDGSLRGVRYTADGTINPRLIQDALMKFLAL